MNNVRRGTWGLPPPSKLEKSLYDLSCVRVTINQTKKKFSVILINNFLNISSVKIIFIFVFILKKYIYVFITYTSFLNYFYFLFLSTFSCDFNISKVKVVMGWL